MNVNSCGHNLDTKKSQQFSEIKHPPGLKTLVGFHSPPGRRKITRRSHSTVPKVYPELFRGTPLSDINHVNQRLS
jgi:hypothetical protein